MHSCTCFMCIHVTINYVVSVDSSLVERTPELHIFTYTKHSGNINLAPTGYSLPGYEANIFTAFSAHVLFRISDMYLPLLSF